MKIASPAGRKPYSAPKLIEYGDIAKFTKGGVGSVVEDMSSNSMERP